MGRLQNTIAFFFFMSFMMDANSSKPETSACEFGVKLREFDSQKKSAHTSADEKLIKGLLAEPMFVRDDEKYIEALKRLCKFPDSRKQAIEKIQTFIEQPKQFSGSVSRERRAVALLSLLDLKDDVMTVSNIDKVRHLLSVELAETVAAKQIPAQELPPSVWLRRIEVLNEKNENQLLISEIRQKQTMLKEKNLFSCRLQFLLGKALRKNRNYKESMEVLDEVSQNCVGDDGRDAAFFLARLAAISPSAQNMKYFEAFEKKYPMHSYADDVMLFKASALESLNKIDEAKKTLSEISKLDAVSDMRFEASFRLAFLHALEGDSSQAIKILNEALTGKFASEMTLMEKHRATYWKARLELFDNVFDVKKSNLMADKSEAKLQLQGLAKSTPQTFYSWLSNELIRGDSTPKEPEKTSTKSVATARNITNPSLATVFCLASGGFQDYAKRFADLIDSSEVKDDERMDIARKLSDVGMYDQAFRFAPTSQGSDPTFIYPKAYEKEVVDAAKQIKVPRNLVFGLMREESRFDARVISWAGARGLLQLMPQVAKTEALQMQIKDLSEEGMLDPKLNILLGARHLKGMLEGLKHPLFAVAAYNAGFKRVKDWEVRFNKINALDAFVENIPLPETRNYVKRVASSWANYSRLYPDQEPLFQFELSRPSTQN